MSGKKKILLAVDGSQSSSNTVSYVAQICDPVSTKVNLMHVLPTAPETFWDQERSGYFKVQMKSEYTEWRKGAKEAAQRFLEEAQKAIVRGGFAESDVGIILQEREEGIARDIMAESAKGYDAVVMGRKGLSKLNGPFLGSVANKIVEAVENIPVWVVGEKIKSKRMLLAVDSSKNSRKMVDYAGVYTANGEAELTLLHVVRAFRLGLINDLNLTDDEIEGFTEQVEADIRRMFKTYKNLLEKAGVGAERISTKRIAQSQTRAGDILREAEEGGYGTIVMGRRGLSKVRQFLMGRVANKVLHRAERFAVWIVP